MRWREVRTYYGIPQSLMADYLGISRSHLSMVETGKRELSAVKTLLLLQLYKAIHARLPGDTTRTAALARQQKETAKAMAKKKLQQLRRQLEQLQQLSASLQNDQHRAGNILQSMPSLQATATPFGKGLLEVVEITAAKLLKKTGESARLDTELRLHCLQAAIAFLEARR